MKKLFFIALLFTGISLWAQNSKNTAKIDGKLLSGNYSQIQLVNAISGESLGTNQIENNKFNFHIDLNEEKILALVLNRNQYILLDVKPGENIEVNYDPMNFSNNSVKGSSGTEFYIDNVKKLRSLSSSQQNLFIDSLVRKNTDKLINLIFLSSLDAGSYSKTYDYVLNKMKKFKDNEAYKKIKSEYDAEKLTAIGSVPPEIALQDTNGNVVKLSSLRGQYVLVDFWASWCRPCRGESPNLVRAYNKYHDKGFTIYSVSLDNSKSSWLQAIKKDNLGAWTHVSDLKGWQCVAARDYNVNSIPSNFLLDKDGKIIAKNLRGSALERKLAEIFNN